MQRRPKLFTSAPSAKHKQIESSSTTESLTISSAYPSKNEGLYWREKRNNNEHKMVMDITITKIDQATVDASKSKSQQKHDQYVMMIQNVMNVIDHYNNANFIDNINFMEIYTCYLYLLHNNDREVFAEIFRHYHCETINCKIFKRNCRNRSHYSTTKLLKDLYGDNNDATIAYLQILDTIHCYCQHNYIFDEEDTKNDDNTNCSQMLQSSLSNQINHYRMISQRQIKYNQLSLAPTNGKDIYCFGCEFCYDGTGEEEQTDTVIILPKFSSLKQELLSSKKNIPNASISSMQFDVEYKKALINFGCKYKKEHYVTMSIDHLLSLMVYCNYTALQNEFSKTYRNSCGYKHNNFYYWGKYLKQAVHQFGTRMCDGNITNLYHGIGEKLLFPQIIGDKGIGVKIYCPLSTSSSLSIAQNFTNMHNGLILDFGGCNKAKYFPVAWLSDFSAESEYLFIQNQYELQIVNIIDTKMGYEYIDIIKSLNIIDQITSEQYLEISTQNISKSIKNLTVDIIYHQLAVSNQNKYKYYKKREDVSQYGMDMINTYCQNKRSIQINYSNIPKEYDFMKKIILNTEYEWIHFHALHCLFPNIQSIMVKNIHLKLAVKKILQHLEYNSVNLQSKLKEITIITNTENDFSPSSVVQNYPKYLGHVFTCNRNVLSIKVATNDEMDKLEQTFHAYGVENDTDATASDSEFSRYSYTTTNAEPNKGISVKRLSNNNKHGLLIYQRACYSKEQMAHVRNQYSTAQQIINKAGLILFSDNDIDKVREVGDSRKYFHGQAYVAGHYDILFAYGIVTKFYESSVPNLTKFMHLIDYQFESVHQHILRGIDIVIPMLTNNDFVTNNKRYCKNGRQVIFHSIGASELAFDYIQYIQFKIDELQSLAQDTKIVEYYGFAPSRSMEFSKEIDKMQKKTDYVKIWQWHDFLDNWKSYDYHISNIVEKLRINDNYTYLCSSNNQIYTIKKISKIKGTQINRKTGNSRDIRRYANEKRVPVERRNDLKWWNMAGMTLAKYYKAKK